MLYGAEAGRADVNKISVVLEPRVDLAALARYFEGSGSIPGRSRDAPPALKAIADLVTEDADHDGLACALVALGLTGDAERLGASKRNY